METGRPFVFSIRCLALLLLALPSGGRASSELAELLAESEILGENVGMVQGHLEMQRSVDEDELLLNFSPGQYIDEAQLDQSELAHFYQTPQYLDDLAKAKLKGPHQEAKMALFILYVRYSPSLEDEDGFPPVWKAFIDELRIKEISTIFWDKDELELIEEERMVEMTNTKVTQVEKDFKNLIEPLLELYPSALPSTDITMQTYKWAVSMVARYGAQVKMEEENPTMVLLPVPVDHRPDIKGGYVYDEESENIQLYASKAFKAGKQIYVAGKMFNDERLLYIGDIYNDVHCAAPPIRVFLSQDFDDESALMKKDLLASAGLESTQDFQLKYGHLEPQLLQWLRVNLAQTDELRGKSHKRFRKPLNLRLEQEAYGSIVKSIEKIFSAYDHSVEEDEYSLENGGLSDRGRLAVLHRKLSKQVLVRNVEMLTEHFEEYEKLDRQKQQQGGAKKTKKKKKKSK